MSQYCLLRSNTIVIKINEMVPVRVAATVNCAVATVAGAMRLAGAVDGKTVAVSGVGMLGVIACAMIFIKNNRAAFYLNQSIIIFAGVLLLFTTILFVRYNINPALWMILNGFSMYLAYIAFHTFLFERWIL